MSSYISPKSFSWLKVIDTAKAFQIQFGKLLHGLHGMGG